MARLAVVPLLLLAAACSDSSGGPDVQTMTLEIENGAGKVDRTCLALPVLLGSVVAQTIDIDGSLEVTTRSTSDAVQLSYTGRVPFDKTYDIEDISYQEWPLTAESGDETYLISLSLGCSGGQTSP
jgi:hypothetical protein